MEEIHSSQAASLQAVVAGALSFHREGAKIAHVIFPSAERDITSGCSRTPAK